MPTVRKMEWDNPYYGFGMLERLAPGIRGHFFQTEHKGVYIPTLLSDKEGKGNVGIYIDHLKEKHSQIRFPNVSNPILSGMLQRRGFIQKREYVPLLKTHANVHVWKQSYSKQKG